MNKFNTKEIIGTDFYAAAPGLGAQRLEHFYNKAYGTIPTALSFSEEFEKSCLAIIQENFNIVCSNITKVGENLIDEGVWSGKEATVYEGSFINVSYKTDAGERLVHELSFMDDTIIVGPSNKDGNALLDNLHVGVRAVCQNAAQALEIVKLLNPFKLLKKSKIYILSSEYGDLNFTGLPVPSLPMDLELNYGSAFLDIHKKLVDSLNNTQSGLYLFYGPPGTGKSSYIKHLLSLGISRKMAYIPVGLIDKLTHPDMLPLLMNNKNIILILEDAEKALLSREISNDSSVVSTILSLTDGFIGQAINISIIATFNTEKDKIDEALLRKGRLRMSYEFKKLPSADSKKLASSLGIDPEKITEAMSLADIYNFNAETNYTTPEEKRVGFF